MPVTTSTTLTNQFQSYFSKEVLKRVQQLTVLSQFAKPVDIPKNNGNQQITMFRWGAPSTSGIQTLGEGTPITASNYRQLSLQKLSKSLTQYGQVISLTDVLRATELLNSLNQATDVTAKDFALWVDTVQRNVLVGSNLLQSSPGSGIWGTAAEGSGTFENSDAVGTIAASGGVCVYGNPAKLTTQSFVNLNNLTADTTITSESILDDMTRLTRNRANKIRGNYVFVTDPRIARDLMRDSDWLNASNYGNKGQPYYNGEVGEIYGCKVVVQTNSFISTGSTTENDKFVMQTSSNGGGTAASRDIIASFMFGDEAFGIPKLTGDDPLSPRVIITDTPDKSDPLNQSVTVGVKAYFTAMRLAAGNTASTGNPAWYLVHRAKTNAIN